jgi:hypothetical protein
MVGNLVLLLHAGQVCIEGLTGYVIPVRTRSDLLIDLH